MSIHGATSRKVGALSVSLDPRGQPKSHGQMPPFPVLPPRKGASAPGQVDGSRTTGQSLEDGSGTSPRVRNRGWHPSPVNTG